MTILSMSDQIKVRSSATRSILEKTDRILGQSHVKVQIENRSSGAPAYTDGKTITLDSSMEPVGSAMRDGFTTKTMALATALNYHELAHVMFTPRLTSDFVKKIRNDGMFMSLNLLEDQAAETRFVKLYTPARHYFTSLVTNYMMENEEYLRSNYVLVSGRLFLPARFRKSFRDNYSRPDLIGDIDRIVAEYKELVWPDDQTQMSELVKEMHELLTEASPPSEPGTPHDQQSSGEPDTDKTRELRGRAEYVEPDEEEDEEDGSPGKEDDEEEDQEQGADSEGDGDPDDAEDEEDNSEEAKGGSAEPRNEEKSEKEDETESEPKSAEDMMEELEQTLDETLNETIDEIEEELNDRIDSIREEESNYRVDKQESPALTRPPRSDEVRTVNSCVDEFRQVEMNHAPGWHHQQRSGKLDPRRYAKALQGSDYVFKRWREGVHDALDFEVVFLLDQSGSMQSKMEPASASLWILKRTFEECDGVITALGFSEETLLLSQRFEHSKAGEVPVYEVIGSTFVTSAMDEAKRILAVSNKALKMCVVISDGGFSDYANAQNRVETFGNPMVFVGIGHDVSRWDDVPNVVHTQSITDPTQLVDVVKNVALRLSEERLTKRGMT